MFYVKIQPFIQEKSTTKFKLLHPKMFAITGHKNVVCREKLHNTLEKMSLLIMLILPRRSIIDLPLDRQKSKNMTFSSLKKQSC